MDGAEKPPAAKEEIVRFLEDRLGRLHARQRLGIEAEHEAQVFGQGLNFFHIENWYSIHSVIRAVLRITGLYGRGHRNAGSVRVRHNEVRSSRLPSAFDGFTILHISDLHADMSRSAMHRVTRAAGRPRIRCLRADRRFPRQDLRPVRPGDRGGRAGPRASAGAGLRRAGQPRHDPHGAGAGGDGHPHAAQRMRGDRAGRRRRSIWPGSTTRISSAWTTSRRRATRSRKGRSPCCCRTRRRSTARPRTPGSTCCWPGIRMAGRSACPAAIPITLDSNLPRRLGAGAWTHEGMAGYTSVGAGSSIVAVRLQLPAGDHAASPEMRLTLFAAQYGWSRKRTRNSRRESRSSPTKKTATPAAMSHAVRPSAADAGKQRKERLRDLVEAQRLAARREVQPPLDEAGQQVADHRQRPDRRAEAGVDAEERRAGPGEDDREDDAADRLGARRAADARRGVRSRNRAARRNARRGGSSPPPARCSPARRGPEP